MLVSVYITTKDRLELLKRAVESVISQTYAHVEIIVADDGSTDGSHDYLRNMQAEGKLTAIINAGESKGACYGRNRAIELAKGEFITGLDDDDYFENWRIEAFLDYWNKEKVDNKNIAGLFDSVIELRSDGKHKYNEASFVSYDQLRHSNAVGNQVFTKTEYLKAIAGFDEKMPALQDWDTWIRLTEKYGELINIQKFSYIIDQIHGEVRISEKKSARIRGAFSLLQEKLHPMSFSEKVSVTDALYRYKQIDININEIFVLLLGFKFRKIAQVLKWKMLNG
ncbi:glycosyltransferase [Shewanella sp. 10N.7]|uniref:glycosyltransferase n=1 Tax=Shewanella sp. 10N.7 TaxID=2885093 RepID=UPI001E5E04C8|nr:glycosyltransferase [Shewanella sp. 10N.7]MCC4833074.1 glycosyltransferase [Shewanella sp. 10N.7]